MTYECINLVPEKSRCVIQCPNNNQTSTQDVDWGGAFQYIVDFNIPWHGRRIRPFLQGVPEVLHMVIINYNCNYSFMRSSYKQ